MRWAESSRILWGLNYAQYIDPAHAEDWKELWTPKGLGLILKSIKVDYKFVGHLLFTLPHTTKQNLNLLFPLQPVEWPDKVSVYHKLSAFSSDSFTLDVMSLFTCCLALQLLTLLSPL